MAFDDADSARTLIRIDWRAAYADLDVIACHQVISIAECSPTIYTRQVTKIKDSSDAGW